MFIAYPVPARPAALPALPQVLGTAHGRLHLSGEIRAPAAYSHAGLAASARCAGSVPGALFQHLSTSLFPFVVCAAPLIGLPALAVCCSATKWAAPASAFAGNYRYRVPRRVMALPPCIAGGFRGACLWGFWGQKQRLMLPDAVSILPVTYLHVCAVIRFLCFKCHHSVNDSSCTASWGSPIIPFFPSSPSTSMQPIPPFSPGGCWLFLDAEITSQDTPQAAPRWRPAAARYQVPPAMPPRPSIARYPLH